MFICGSRSFGHQDINDDHDIKTSKQSKRSMMMMSFRKIRDKNRNKIHNNNPYADRGLDKFYALVAELEDKKQQIYTKIGSSEDVSFVRFVYSDDSDTVKPIVVRVKADKKKNKQEIIMMNSPPPPRVKNHNQVTEKVVQFQEKNEELVASPHRHVTPNNISYNKQSTLVLSYYFAAVIVLVLVFLAMQGRSFAILCTSILWYVVPYNTVILQGSTSTTSRSSRKLLKTKKNEFVSGNKVVHSRGPSSPTSN